METWLALVATYFRQGSTLRHSSRGTTYRVHGKSDQQNHHHHHHCHHHPHHHEHRHLLLPPQRQQAHCLPQWRASVLALEGPACCAPQGLTAMELLCTTRACSLEQAPMSGGREEIWLQEAMRMHKRGSLRTACTRRRMGWQGVEQCHEQDRPPNQSEERRVWTCSLQQQACNPD